MADTNNQSRTAAATATTQIVNLIADGLLPRNERARETELADRLSVSRVPLREAMNRLASQGVLEPRPRGGMNVKAFSPDEVREIAEVRAALEPMAMRAAAPKLKIAENRIQLNAIIEELAWSAEQGDRAAIAAADVAFHRYLIELSGNRLIRQIWAGLELQLVIIFRLELTETLARDQVVPKHKELRDLLLSDDLSRLDAVLADHVWV